MARLIDADKLKQHYSWWNDVTKELFDEIVDLQPTAEPVKYERWIPCKDALPDIGDTYLVTVIQKDANEKEWHYFVDVASNYGDYIDDYWDTFNDWIEGQETHIIAWTLLPKPYNKDGATE